jgi:voltage-gated potassium channel
MTKELSVILRQKREEFVIVVSDENEYQELKDNGYEVSLLDLEEDKNLLEVGIHKNVKTLFCLHEQHHKNLFVTLSARSLNSSLHIISIASIVNEKKKLLLAGANRVISPYEIASYRIFRHIVKPTVSNVLDNILFSNIDIKISEIKVSSNSELIGVEFYKNRIEDEYDILIIGIKSEKYGKDFYYNTKKIFHKILEDDVLVVMGLEENIERFKEEL